jgi:hypothetical protein
VATKRGRKKILQHTLTQIFSLKKKKRYWARYVASCQLGRRKRSDHSLRPTWAKVIETLSQKTRWAQCGDPCL